MSYSLQQQTNLTPAMHHNLSAVLSFFQDKKQVHRYLTLFAAKYNEYELKGQSRSFRQFFQQWGESYGFNQGRQGHVVNYKTEKSVRVKFAATDFPATIPTLVGVLPARLFVNVFMKRGYLINDPGAGALHGKWTHTLQIFMLQEALNAGELTLKECDSIRSLYYQISLLAKAPRIFQEIFDSQKAQDYTRPEKLHRALMEVIDEHAPGVARVREKVENYNKKMALSPTDYMAKKLANAQMSLGSEPQRSFLWGVKQPHQTREDVAIDKEVTPLEMFKRMTEYGS